VFEEELLRKMSIMAGVIPVGWQCLVRLQKTHAQPSVIFSAYRFRRFLPFYNYIGRAPACLQREQDIGYEGGRLKLATNTETHQGEH